MNARQHAFRCTAKAFGNVECRSFSHSQIALKAVRPANNQKRQSAPVKQALPITPKKDVKPATLKKYVGPSDPKEDIKATSRTAIAKLDAELVLPEPNLKPTGYAYSENLLIWNAGVFKNALIGLIKNVPLVYLGWGWGLWAPSLIVSPDSETWMAIPALMMVTIPWLITNKATAPYVATVRLRLPAQARVSKQSLGRFSANIPQSTELEFTTIGLLGLQKRVVTTLGKLSLHTSILGIGNLERVVDKTPAGLSTWAKYKRWMRDPGSTLYVGGKEGQTRSNAPGMWDAVFRQIENRPVPRHTSKNK